MGCLRHSHSQHGDADSSSSLHFHRFTHDFSLLKNIPSILLIAYSAPHKRSQTAISNHNMDVLEVGFVCNRRWSPHGPTCLLCGNIIHYAVHCAPLRSYQRAVGRQLQRAHEQGQVVIPAKKVEEHYLVNFPWLSTCTFRASESIYQTDPLAQVLTAF